MFAAYSAENTFHPGDMVIEKKDCPSPYKEGDKPLIVVEVGCSRWADMGACQNGEGEDRSLRIGTLNHGRFTTYLVNPNYFEHYVG